MTDDITTIKNCVTMLREISYACGQGYINALLSDDINFSDDVTGLTIMIQYLNKIIPAFGEAQIEYSVSTVLDCLYVLSNQFKAVFNAVA